MGNSVQQYRSSIGNFHSKICSSSWKLRSSSNAKEKFENNINIILHVLTIAIIRAEINDLLSSVISVCQTILFLCTYSVWLVSALKIFYTLNSLSENPAMDPRNLSQNHGTSTLKVDSEVFVSPHSIAAFNRNTIDNEWRY